MKYSLLCFYNYNSNFSEDEITNKTNIHYQIFQTNDTQKKTQYIKIDGCKNYKSLIIQMSMMILKHEILITLY
jgi:hypothetical protein